MTKEQILEAAETVLRRHGPTKTTVLDVAEALNVSHGSIYRFFPSKAELRDAVVDRWLGRVSAAMLPLSQASGNPQEDLLAWFQGLRKTKLVQFRDDPELFEAFRVLAMETREVLGAYKDEMARQIAGLLQRGIDEGVFDPVDPIPTARALMAATSIYHHPSQAVHWGKPGSDEAFETLWRLLTRGLAARTKTTKE